MARSLPAQVDVTAEVPEQYWACRSDGHWNIRIPNPDNGMPTFGLYRWLVCQRCNRMVRQTIHRGSEVFASRTFYPPGYLVRGMGQVNRKEFRRALIKTELAAEGLSLPAEKSLGTLVTPITKPIRRRR